MFASRLVSKCSSTHSLLSRMRPLSVNPPSLASTPSTHVQLPLTTNQPQARHLYVISKADHDKLLEMAKLSDAKYKLALADMENLRQRLNKQIEDTKQFAISGFCKDLIEITDVFEMAMKQITPESVGQSNYEGISMIEQRMIAIFKRHGLISLNPKGQRFDPNEHQAMFEVPDESREPGTVCEVCNVGWKLHERIVRPAKVGVVKRPGS